MSVEAGLPGELGLALVTLEGLFSRVGLHVASQGLFVLERRSTIGTGKGHARCRVKALVN
jgi:hypothetical protein